MKQLKQKLQKETEQETKPTPMVLNDKNKFAMNIHQIRLQSDLNSDALYEI